MKRYDALLRRLSIRALICFHAALGIPTQSPLLAQIQIDKIQLPKGFTIRTYAENVPNARSMSLSPNGTLFVGSRREGKFYAVVDNDGNGEADRVHVLGTDMFMPNGVAFRNGSLYVAEVNRILRYDNIESRLENPPEPVVINDSLPDKRLHGWKFIRFGPDGYLYVPVGAPCNICEPETEIFASITRMRPDGSGLEVFVSGVRNSVGFDWHPVSGNMWFTDNGRDMLGDDIPPDELNQVTRKGQHFGYPYCHGGDISDPELGEGKECGDYVAPAMKLGPHVASLGLRFYTGSMFPAEYRQQIFLAEHGSWNRSKKIGYRVSLVRVKDNKAVSYEPFATGWLQGEEAWGRPVDLEIMPDGSMLVSDDHAGVIYRISYKP